MAIRNATEVPAVIAGNVPLVRLSEALARAGLVGRHDADRLLTGIEIRVFLVIDALSRFSGIALFVPLISLFSSLNNFLIPQPLAPLAVMGAQGPTSRSAPRAASETRLSPPESRGSLSPPTGTEVEGVDGGEGPDHGVLSRSMHLHGCILWYTLAGCSKSSSPQPSRRGSGAFATARRRRGSTPASGGCRSAIRQM